MTKREQARALYEKGWQYDAIGYRLGVSKATAYRWTHPEYEERQRQKSREWKRRNQAQQVAYNRRYHATHKDVCPSCGGEMNRGHKTCRPCLDDEADRKARQVERMWAEGKKIPEICAEMEWSKGALAVMMDRYRAQGYDLPYRYKPGPGGWATKFPDQQKAA